MHGEIRERREERVKRKKEEAKRRGKLGRRDKNKRVREG
jgi:hypothetical protein